MINDNLRRHVFHALDNAVDNDFQIYNWSIDDIVEDLQQCESDLETVPGGLLRPIVTEWITRYIERHS